MNECICCRDRLIKYLNNHRTFWYCPSCHQEMPNVDEIKTRSVRNQQAMVSVKDYPWRS